MIKNFAEVKRQLGELAPAINSFKSEAVQLRIVELIFQSTAEEVDGPIADVQAKKTPQRRSKAARKTGAKRSAEAGDNKRGKTLSTRPGPGATVAKLLEEGFFKERRIVGDIVKHCRDKLAVTHGASEISVSLGRAIRGNTLKRSRNEDGQYEYFQ